MVRASLIGRYVEILVERWPVDSKIGYVQDEQIGPNGFLVLVEFADKTLFWFRASDVVLTTRVPPATADPSPPPVS